MLKFGDVFDRINVVNLDRRPDRLKRFEKRLKEATGEIIDNEKIFRYPAIDGSTLTDYDMPEAGHHWGAGAEGCRRSHLNILNTAKADNLESVLIFEDDAVFRSRLTIYDHLPKLPTFNEIFIKFMHDLPHDWEMAYLGGNYWKGVGSPTITVDRTPSIVSRLVTLTTHAYAVKHTAYDALIHNATVHNKPVDLIFAEEVQPHFNTYGATPRICAQEDGLSDVMEIRVDHRGVTGVESDDWELTSDGDYEDDTPST